MFPMSLEANGLPSKNIAFLGACHVETLIEKFTDAGYVCHHFLYHSRGVDISRIDVSKYDFVIVALVLRYIIGDVGDENADFWLAREKTSDDVLEKLERAKDIISKCVAEISELFRDKPVFFMNFMEPQFNPNGLLLNYSTLENPQIFVRRLNEHLGNLAFDSKNYILDVNGIVSGIGKSCLQDDLIYEWSHANIISNFDYEKDLDRIDKPAEPVNIFSAENAREKYFRSVLVTFENSLRIIEQKKSVKLIVVDLDGTLWRGVAADDLMEINQRTQGWPFGLIEALLYYKKRGGLLAINSKNDYEETIRNFNRIWGNKISLSDFVSIKINRNPKSKNIREILNETNLLSDNVVMLDDNPRELDEVRFSFPGIRSLGTNPYLWRITIINHPDFQVPRLTLESKVRTETTRLAVERRLISKDENAKSNWLNNLELKLEVFSVDDSLGSVRFERGFELLNKTNQFNSTGVRYTKEEYVSLCKNNMVFLYHAKDRTADYGIVSVVCINDYTINHWVLSCRVFGLSIENAILTDLMRRLKLDKLVIKYFPTDKNSTFELFINSLKNEKINVNLYSIESTVENPKWVEFV